MAGADLAAADMASIYDGAQSPGACAPVLVASYDGLPGDNYEERVYQQTQQIRKGILEDRARAHRELAGKSWLNVGISGLAVAGSVTGLTLGLGPYPNLMPIFGYAAAGLLFALSIYRVYQMIADWDKMSTVDKVLGVLGTILQIGMGIMAIFSPASWGLGALVTMGAMGLVSGIVNTVEAVQHGNEADKAQEEADAIPAAASDLSPAPAEVRTA